NRRVVFSTAGDGDPNQPDALLDQAAIRLLDDIRPAQAAKIHNNFGNDRHREGKTEEAVAEYRAAIALGPTNEPGSAVPHYNLGNVLREQGKLEDAIDEYRAAIALDPTDVAFRSGLGLALAELGKPDEAIAQYQEAVSRNPNESAPYT